MDNMDKIVQQILVQMNANAYADRKERKAEQEDLLARMEAKMDSNQKKAEEDRKAHQEKMAADKEDFLARMDAIHEKRMDMLDDHQKRMMATKKIELDTGMMQSMEEHQDVPSEDVAVMSVKGLKKRRRERKSTAGRRGEPKKLNRGNCGSRKQLAAACRKVSRHAAVVWRKRNLIRQIWTEVNCGPRSTLATDGKMTSCRAKVAWLKRDIARRECTGDNVASRNQRGRTCKMRPWIGSKCNNSIGDRGLNQNLQGRIGIKNPDAKLQLRLRIEQTSDEIGVKIFKLVNEKRTAESFMALRKIKKWTLLRGRPPPKRKKKSCS
jgi:hypothetical protein